MQHPIVKYLAAILGSLAISFAIQLGCEQRGWHMSRVVGCIISFVACVAILTLWDYLYPPMDPNV